MRVKSYKVYKFEELSDKSKEKAIENLCSINIEHDWYDFTYEDAKNIGLEIQGFDVDRGSYVKAKFLSSAEETAHKIEKEHGDQCNTYTTAKDYLKERDELIDTWPKDENGEHEDVYKLDDKLDELDKEFLHSLCEDYLVILRNECEYLMSKEAIIETIEANEYEFTEDGKLD